MQQTLQRGGVEACPIVQFQQRMERVLAYSIAGAFVGSVLGFFVSLLGDLPMFACLAGGGGVGCASGCALARRFNRDRVLARPFVTSEETAALKYVIDVELRSWWLPVRMRKAIISKLDALLKRLT